MHPSCSAKPDKDGWVKNSEGGLLYWVPHNHRESVHSPAVMTIPLTSRNRSVSLDFDDFAFGTSWGQIFKSAPFSRLVRADIEPMRRHIVAGKSLLESRDRKVILWAGCGGAHVARHRHSCSLWDYELLVGFRQISIDHLI